MYRRTLMTYALRAASVLPFLRVRLEAAVTELPAESVAALKDLAAIVLPSSLGRRRTDVIAVEFARWVREYRPGVPMDPGYGQPRLRNTPPSPADDYVAQLKALDSAARTQGKPLARLGREAQQKLVETALTEAKVQILPQRPTGQHVASDLMAFYFQSSEANDYAYRAEIGRHKCRPLEVSTKRPKPLEM
jgi:hypothetical protein